MNIQEFREKYPQYQDIDDQTLAAKLHQKYYSDIPVDQFNAKFLGTDQKLDHQQGRFQEWMQKGAGMIAPALPMAGMLAGGAVGTTAAGPAGGVGGAALGYAGGRQLENVLQNYSQGQKPPTFGEQAKSAATDIPVGAAMEAGGAVLGKGLEFGLQQVAKAAPRIYESVAKIPPRSVPKFERDKAISTALENQIPATQKGLGKLRGKIEDLNDKISGVIEGAKGPRGNISIPDILKRLDDVKTWASKSYADPTPVLKAIEDYKTGVSATRGGAITVADAQKLKQGIYRRLTDAAYGEFSTPQKEMDKAFARGIKEALVKQFPQLQKLNADDSALINLSNILEKTVSRTRNWDVAGLSEYGGAIAGGTAAGGPGAGVGLVVAKMLKSPAVMSRVAFALNKAGKMAAPRLAPRLAAYGALRGAQPQVPDLATPAAAEEFRMPQPGGGGVGFDIKWGGGHTDPRAMSQDRGPSRADPLVNTATTEGSKGTRQGYDRAIKILLTAIKLDPSRTDELHELIERYNKDKKYAQR